MSSAEAKASIFVVSSATAATILAIGFVSVVALEALPLHAALAAGTVFGVGGVTAIVYKMTGVIPFPGARDLRTLSLSAIAGVALAFFGSGFLALETALIPAFAETAARHAEMMHSIVRPDSVAMIPLVLLVVCVLPAFFEEVLFRGVLRRYLTKSVSKAGRILIVGVLFGLMHVSAFVLLPLIYAGVLWTFLAERSGGWLAPAVSHFAMNATSAVLLVRVGTFEQPGLILAVSLVALGSVVASVALAKVSDRNESR